MKKIVFNFLVFLFCLSLLPAFSEPVPNAANDEDLKSADEEDTVAEKKLSEREIRKKKKGKEKIIKPADDDVILTLDDKDEGK